MDATPSEFGLLGEGTAKMVRDFLLSMRIDAEPAEWTIKPFCTYYYSQFFDSDDFRYIFPQAFAMHVRFASRFDGPAPKDPFESYSSTQYDPTWDANKLPWDWERNRLIIVADCFGRTPAELMTSLEARPLLKEACRDVEIVRLHPNVLQMRMDIGEVKFPDDLKRAYSLMEEASHFCRTFRWAESVALGA